MNWVKGIVYSIVVAGFAFAIFEMICWTIKYPDEVWWVYPYNLGFKLLVHPAFTMLFAIVFIYLNPPNIFTVPFSHL